MRWVFFVAVSAGLLVFSGCAGGKAPSARPPSASAGGPLAAGAPALDQKLIITPQEGLEGKIALVNSSLRFVVMTFPVGQMPGLDQQLSVYRHGLKVGEVKVTGPQRDDSVAGDIVEGEAGTDDVVRDR